MNGRINIETYQKVNNIYKNFINIKSIKKKLNNDNSTLDNTIRIPVNYYTNAC